MKKTYEQVLVEIQLRKQQLAAQTAPLFDDGKPVVLEMGCGHGHFLIAYAEAQPAVNFIGIDLISKRIEKALQKKKKRELSNITFMKANVNEFFEVLPQTACFDQLFMLFPDPWPKKRHHKNRMIQEALLSKMAQHTHPGSRFHFRTDDTSYFEWAQERIDEHPAWTLRIDAQWPFEENSYFQNLMESWESLIAENHMARR